MGSTAPWLIHVREVAAQMPWKTKVKVNVRKMARVMADCDLAIGAGGSTAWERACLGLPSLIVVLADNQKNAAQSMGIEQVAKLIPLTTDLPIKLRNILNDMISQPAQMLVMSLKSSKLTDGNGTKVILNHMTRLVNQ